MRHRELRQQLADYAAGRLDRATRAEIERHLESCAACAEWVATYDLCAGLLGASRATRHAEHPSAGRLARHSLAHSGFQPEATAVDRHLETCAACRRQVELSRQAVAWANDQRSDSTPIPEPHAARFWSRPRTTLAASVLLALLAGGALWLYRAGEPQATPPPGMTALEGVQVIELGATMVAEATEIRPFSNITFRSHEAVAFGEGFTVGDQATLVVEIHDGD